MKPHTVPLSALTAEPSRGSAVDGVASDVSALRHSERHSARPSQHLSTQHLSTSSALYNALTLLTLLTPLWMSAGCTPLEFGDPSDKLECLEHNDCGAAQRCVEGVCERLSREVCDGLDNDYDGQTDEGLLNACGECGSPPREVCDELDNDCDGVVDEGFEDKGLTCSPDPSNPNIIGEWLCLNEELKCIPSQLSRPEECNGEDDDLDGAVDEGLSFNPISCSLGSCRPSSTPRCEAGVVVSGCDEASAEDDASCDGYDDDCDGVIDEDAVEPARSCALSSALAESCTLEAARVCVEGVWSDEACERLRAETPERCDGIDNNCNGEVDEPSRLIPSEALELGELLGEPCQQGACSATYRYFCVNQTEYVRCTNLTTYNPNSSTPDPFDPAIAALKRDLCGQGDEDCDGLVDEDALPTVASCSDEPNAPLGAWACHEVELIPEDGTAPELVTQRALVGCGVAYPERCNGLDDDLDGVIDEDSAEPGAEPVCTCPFFDEPDDSSEDTNCDGVDGRRSNALFVSATYGDDTNNGTAIAPLASLQGALNLLTLLAAEQAQSTPELTNERPHQVYLDAGTYAWSSVMWDQALIPHLELYGSYIARLDVEGQLTWSRPTLAEELSAPEFPGVTLQAPFTEAPFKLTQPHHSLTLQRLKIELSTPPATSTLTSVIGLNLMSCERAHLSDVTVSVSSAPQGAQGSDAPLTPITSVEARGQSLDGVLPGRGGQNIPPENLPNAEARCAGGDGGNGGAPFASGFDGAPAALGGRGGDELTLNGEPGAQGAQGQNARAASSVYGEVALKAGATLEAPLYTWRPLSISTPATDGLPGGGGGGGAGTLDLELLTRHGGGGGGAGGCGGAAGESGRSGGSSVGLLLSPLCAATFERVRLITAQGGDGGAGGSGTPGADGALGGFGALTFGEGVSGDGGQGGRGGCGGHGVSGHGGSSIGALLLNGAPFPQGLSIELGAPGAPGEVASSTAARCGEGESGAPGVAAEYVCCPTYDEQRAVFSGCDLCLP